MFVEYDPASVTPEMFAKYEAEIVSVAVGTVSDITAVVVPATNVKSDTESRKYPVAIVALPDVENATPNCSVPGVPSESSSTDATSIV